MTALSLEHQRCSVLPTRPSPTQSATYFHLPNLERLRRWICSHPAGTLIDTSVRRLAEVIGCGPGAITPALRRMADDGLIDHIAAPSGTLIEVRISDLRGAPGGDQEPDHRPAPAAALPQPEPAPDVIRVVITGRGDQELDHPMGNKELYLDQDMQQQHAREHVFAVAEELPAGLTATEWATIRALVPGYDLTQLRADLARLASRPGVRNPVGVLIAAYRRGEPIWGRDELQVHNAQVMAEHVPATPAEPPPPPPPSPKRSRPDRAPAAPPADPTQIAPHGALWDHLLLLVADSGLVDWLCGGFNLEVRQDATVLRCRSADHARVACDLRGLLADALLDLGLPGTLEIPAPGEARPAADQAEHPAQAPDAPPAEQSGAPILPAPVQLAAPPAEQRAASALPPAPTPAERAQELPKCAHGPPAEGVPLGTPVRPRRPQWSPWRAS